MCGSAAHREALRLRDAVLRKPLGLKLQDQEIAADRGCFHLGCFDSRTLLGVLLLMPLSTDTARMRQVAVRPEYQRRGIGGKLLLFAESFAREKGYAVLLAHARTSALRFYERAGYVATGEKVLEKTVEHQLVIKHLS